jgi:prepilin-type N-terminal cleavage/methylation domain-containing protein
MKNNNKGFTLIEILVVIGIIAILAAIVLIAINPARQFRQANDSQRTSNVNAVLNAIGQYIADNKGALPSGVPAVGAAAVEIRKAAGGADLCATLVPKYLPALPIDPTTGTDPATAGDDEQVAESECAGTYNTKYTIEQVSAGRIKITAPDTQEAASDIAVTR